MIKELNIPTSEWQVGKSKVFLRSIVHEPLEDARKQVINGKAVTIQTAWRRYYEQKKYAKIRKAVLQIQHAHKGWRSRIDFLRKRRACIVIQSHLRGLFAREVAAALREMRRVEEEMRKRERLEAERREREKQISEQQAEDERKAIEECERYVSYLSLFVAEFFFISVWNPKKKKKKNNNIFEIIKIFHLNRILRVHKCRTKDDASGFFVFVLKY